MEPGPIYAVVAVDHPWRDHPAEGDGRPPPSPAPEGDEPFADAEPGLVLHYHLPEHLLGSVGPGHLVVVPLRGMPVAGVVVGLADSSPVQPTQPVLRLLDSRPVLPAAMLSLARWIAGYYRCTLWQALAPMLPPGVARRAITTVTLSSNVASAAKGEPGTGPLLEALGRRQRQVVSLLRSAPGARLTTARLRRRYTGAPSGLNAAVLDLERKGLVTRETQLPSPRTQPKKERFIRLAIPPEAASDAIREASHRAPLQAAALTWLFKRLPSGSGSPSRHEPEGQQYPGEVGGRRAGGHPQTPGQGSAPVNPPYWGTAGSAPGPRREGRGKTGGHPQTPGQGSAPVNPQSGEKDGLEGHPQHPQAGTGGRGDPLHPGLQGAKELQNPKSKIQNEEGWLLLRDLYLHTGATSSTVSALQRKGHVELTELPVHRSPVPPTASSPRDEPPALTPAQAVAWREIAGALREWVGGRGSGVGNERDRATDPRPPTPMTPTFLLHGVTGSGKTEIYLRAIGMVLRMGKQAIVLVPEISLTPQAVHRFASRFPGRVALIHSQLSPGQQFDEWRRIREGHADIVIGSRSAIFAPLPRLGLIVVDEEHEWAYKQQDFPPRYHAREVALKRAELTGAVTILGSATPDLATYHHARTGRYTLLSLPTRVGRRRGKGGVEWTTELPMPQMQVVDLRAELRSGNRSIFSRALQAALRDTLARREQAILYLNRRGSHSFIICHECGYVPLCRRCDVPLVLHEDVYGLLCHRCNAFSLTPHECPRCGSARIKGFGVGTQRVVDEVAALFPRARVLRWDRDTASRQGGHSNLMEMFARGEADVLVGTQMIAKGLDIDRVTLVGVVSADTGLYLPDFRAPERTMQLLMQVAGRAGRRTETTHSRVVVQTFNPDHYAIQAAVAYDYEGFYSGEIRFRAEHGYPPYGELARVVFTSADDHRCEREAGVVARYLQQRADGLVASGTVQDLDVLGPTPCFVHKVRGRYRWQVLLRGERLAPLLDGFYPAPGCSLDVDPISLL